MSADTTPRPLGAQVTAAGGVIPARGRLGRLIRAPEAPVMLALVALVVVFSALRPSQFATATNFENIITDASILLVMSVGMTYVVITAGIDLSVGSVLVFGGVLAAQAMGSVGGEGTGTVLIGLGVTLGAGLAWGLLNGILIAKAKLSPLIVTLATLGMALGGAQIITGGVDLREVPLSLVTTIGNGDVLGVPWLTVIALAVTVVGALVLRFTRFGRHTYIIGSNPQAARRAGIDVDRHLIRIYAMVGVLCGLAGFMSLSRFATTTIAGHSMDNLQAISAVVLGGTSLFGGSGSVGGTVIGVFIPVVLLSGFVITGVQPFWQQVAVGVILILAVLADRMRRQARDRE